MPYSTDNMRIVLISVPSEETASHIARILVEQKLAACVNIVPGLKSVYRWEGEITEDNELLLIVKTSFARYAELEKRVVELHPYDTPEVVCVNITAGFEKYLSWVACETSTK